MDDTHTSATLLLRLRDLGDQEAWNEFVERYAPQVFRWCRENSLQDSDASDVTQEVLGKLVVCMQDFEYQPNKGSFRGWLRTVTRNAVRDLARRWERKLVGSGDTQVHEFLHHIAAPEKLETLRETIQSQYEQELIMEAESRVKLRVNDRTWRAYRMAAVDQIPAKQVAEQLQMPISEVYVSKSRVIRHLRDEVARLSDETGTP